MNARTCANAWMCTRAPRRSGRLVPFAVLDKSGIMDAKSTNHCRSDRIDRPARSGNAGSRHKAARWGLGFLVSGCLLAACIQRPPALDDVRHPETGYVFPPLSEIATVEFRGHNWGVFPDFAIPESSWEELLEALSPSQRDPRPAPWIALGDIWITTRSGDKHYVALYSVAGESVGAFSAGRSEDSHCAYRGGNSEQLMRTLKLAYARYASAERGAKPEEAQ